MLLDEADSQLFFAVLPAFIASLPRPILVSEDQVLGSVIAPDNVQGQLAVNIATVNLRQAIHELPRRLNPGRSAQHLTEDACAEAAQALEDILCEMELLIGIGILDRRTIDQTEKFNRLSALRDLVGNAPWPDLEEEPVVSPDALKWVTYLQLENSATEAAQYRCITNQVERFNDTMRRLFDLESRVDKPTAARFVESTRLSPEIDEKKRDTEALLAAEKLCFITRNLSSLMHQPNLEPCNPPHGVMIHLNGFDQLEIDTLITICGPDKPGKEGKAGRLNTEKWHEITWVAGAPVPKTTQSTICQKVRWSRTKMTRLRILVGLDGSWSGTTSERMGEFAKKPVVTLDSALNSKQGPWLKKKERLDLAIKIARSLFYLIRSPWVCSPWSSATIHILEQRGQTAKPSATVKPYIESQMRVHDSDLERKPECKNRKSLILDIGVLLWELLLGRKIVVNSEDGRGEEEDSDESDDEDTIFYALSREEITARDCCVDEICLDIIANCLDLYVLSDDESTSATLQSDIYYKIVRPLWNYVETYNDTTSSAASYMRASSLLPAHRRISELTTPSPPGVGLPWAPYLNPALHTNVTIPVVAAPLTSSSHPATAALLTSGGTTTSSADWLERFDVLKKYLQNTTALSSPVKIAILDTGCDMESDFFTGPGVEHVDSVEANWTDYVGGKVMPVDEDPGKHGTALAALLLRLIPNCASIHVARVAQNATKLTDAKENTVKAIVDAIRIWKADIISISFGFGTESPAVKKAILEAETKRDERIIFFAASNNDGLNEPELFPAELENVVSVRGTLHDGEFKQKYNPDPWAHKSGLAQFGTLAVDVPCAWTNDTLTKSGCSVATPIMAAIAAIVISYVGTYANNFPPGAHDVVRTRRGILSVFLEMTKGQGRTDRRYLAPWFLFERGPPLFLIGNALRNLPQKDPTS